MNNKNKFKERIVLGQQNKLNSQKKVNLLKRKSEEKCCYLFF